MTDNDVKILIVEDEPLIAADIEDLCTEMGYTVGDTVYNAGQALIYLQNNNPTLVLLDINLSDDVDGIEIATLLEEKYRIPYVFITSYTDSRTLSRVNSLNHQGYIVKPFNKKQFAATLMLAISNSTPQDQRKELDKKYKLELNLSKREGDILSHLLDGLSLKEIGQKLYISTNTVKYHQKNLYIKLDVHSRAELFSKFLS